MQNEVWEQFHFLELLLPLGDRRELYFLPKGHAYIYWLKSNGKSDQNSIHYEEDQDFAYPKPCSPNVPYREEKFDKESSAHMDKGVKMCPVLYKLGNNCFVLLGKCLMRMYSSP